MVLGPTKTEGAEGEHLLTPVVVELRRRRLDAQADERERAGDAWQQHTYEDRAVDVIFTTATGGLLLRQSVAKAVAAAATKAGIDPRGLGTQAGRSTAITALYTKEGLDLADIARYVGHANSTTTAGYVRHLGRRPSSDGESSKPLARPDDHRRLTWAGSVRVRWTHDSDRARLRPADR